MEFIRPSKQENLARKLIRDFKVLALDYSDAAVFSPKDCESLAETINNNPDTAREDWTSAAKVIVGEMEKEFEFKRCGQTLAQMLEAKVVQVQQKREADAQQRRNIQACIEADKAARKRQLDELRKGGDEE